jgi:DNA repair exonuclease SbcCD ATPase subunit
MNVVQRLIDVGGLVREKQGQVKLLSAQVDNALRNMKRERRKAKRYATLKELITEVALNTQEELRVHISSIATNALCEIFETKYEVFVEFVSKRNKTEATVTVKKEDGEPVRPTDAHGGGVVEVVAFCLRLALWNIHRTSDTFLFDEPFTALKGKDYQLKARNVMKQLSDRLGIQMVIISHEATIIEGVDRVIQITQRKGVSKGEVKSATS